MGRLRVFITFGGFIFVSFTKFSQTVGTNRPTVVTASAHNFPEGISLRFFLIQPWFFTLVSLVFIGSSMAFTGLWALASAFLLVGGSWIMVITHIGSSRFVLLRSETFQLLVLRVKIWVMNWNWVWNYFRGVSHLARRVNISSSHRGLHQRADWSFEFFLTYTIYSCYLVEHFLLPHQRASSSILVNISEEWICVHVTSFLMKIVSTLGNVTSCSFMFGSTRKTS